MANHVQNLKDFEEAEPYVRAAAAFIIFLVRTPAAPDETYARYRQADQFVARLKADLKAKCS